MLHSTHSGIQSPLLQLLVTAGWEQLSGLFTWMMFSGRAPLHWKFTVAYQELADELWDWECQLCDIFHCRGIGSCRSINPVYCNHVHLACVQYGMDKPFNPGRFGTQSPVESSETSTLDVFQSRARANMLFTGAGVAHVSEEAARQLLKVFSGARHPGTSLRWCNNTFQSGQIQKGTRYFNEWDNICRGQAEI